MSYTQAIFYEIFVQSFADSNGDGIGDINGMTAKLDYLQELGITAVWLMPICPSPSYHKYDVTNYYSVHPDYGTLDGFKNFVHHAHARGIKVIIDFVINHTSSQHPWFLNARTGIHAKYRDYYIWADKEHVAEQIEKKETSADSDNIRQWHRVGTKESTAQYYYGFFNSDMPDLNHDNPAVRNEVYAIGKFWLSEVGVDGFRMDAAKHIFPDDRAADTHAFWKAFRAQMQSVKPDAYLIGEVWSDARSASPYAAGFSSLFNFDLAQSILESVDKRQQKAAAVVGNSYKISEGQRLVDIINESAPWFKAHNEHFAEASFLSNHDQNRTASALGGKADKIKLAACILFTLPGIPFIYYGEELGMLGIKPDEHIREPMLWDEIERDTYRTRWITPRYSTDETVVPATQQMTDSNSMYSLYKQLIALKKTALFSLGAIESLPLAGGNILAFSRRLGEMHALVYHNLSAKKTSITIPVGYREAFVRGKVKISDDVLTLGARASLVLTTP
ncbi:alpha-amylase family glycosyl hydrolase [uncultured Imperialibacter sp.]|uniref:alpha-amylase family glycosyl hydrolase n=1 Tax=uncultured Imperialibacter sp. TaxID=1672639 RepID=UPI0030DB9609|tara:strand:+ start:1801 stop:3312 length:1512 start_codon:yes stop_codon:yes gene_type:complete